jgi:hypothetical protein
MKVRCNPKQRDSVKKFGKNRFKEIQRNILDYIQGSCSVISFATMNLGLQQYFLHLYYMKIEASVVCKIVKTAFSCVYSV